jgi:neural Wiskott-Aldrich syndrome protein
MISSPNVHSFVHVAHVGVNNHGAIETSKGIDPSWNATLNGLHGNHTGSKVVVADEDTDLVDGFWRSVDAIGRSNGSETTIIDTRQRQEFSL